MAKCYSIRCGKTFEVRPHRNNGAEAVTSNEPVILHYSELSYSSCEVAGISAKSYSNFFSRNLLSDDL
jgi:hypothetical protein